jgi:hypothetical protein
MLNKLVVLIFMIGLSSGLGVDLDCPDEIYVDEEFECGVEVDDGDGVYDLKVEVDKERNSVLRIWTGEVWQSGYYYLKEFVESGGVIGLKVSKVGRYDVAVKLRQGDDREDFEVGRIRVKDARATLTDGSLTQSKDGSASLDGSQLKTVGGSLRGGLAGDVILLSGDEIKEEVVEDGWDYVSKNGLVIDWLPYGFCLFLICLVGLLMMERTEKY